MGIKSTLSVLRFELHLGNDQPGVGPGELIDLPGQAFVLDDMTRLLDEGTFAKVVEHRRRVGGRDRVFELQSRETGTPAFDSEEPFCAGHPGPHRHEGRHW